MDIKLTSLFLDNILYFIKKIGDIGPMPDLLILDLHKLHPEYICKLFINIR